jgi:phosphoribosylformimino-5-aminoimidazole carboxamide ribotide isomerase
MILYPAIDLRHGRCVRLRQGDPNAETVFGEDPAAMAVHWVTQGAEWLHVVNLDGAFDASSLAAPPGNGGLSAEFLEALPVNWRSLFQICQAVPVPIQFGGGMRRIEDIDLALALGATRVVLGTVALRDPQVVRDALSRFGAGRIIIGIDAREGRVAVQGWTETSDVSAIALATSMAEAGVRQVVYTDISRDGMLTGVDVEATAALASAAGLDVIASGGVRGLEDIRLLLEADEPHIRGVITGQALYTGKLDLVQALQMLKDS